MEPRTMPDSNPDPPYDPANDPAVWDSPGLLTTREVYLAGPFFTPEQAAEIGTVERLLTNLHFTFFSPRVECRYRVGDPRIVAERAFFLNKHHVKFCGLVLACLSWSDAGTAWELGLADAWGRPRVAWTANSKVGLNLMVEQTVDLLLPLDRLADFLIVVKNSGAPTATARAWRGRVPEFWTGERE